MQIAAFAGSTFLTSWETASGEAVTSYTFPDGTQVSPVKLGWSSGDNKVLEVTPFVVPNGKQITGSPSYQITAGKAVETYQTQDIPAPVYTRVARYTVVGRLTDLEGNTLLAAFNESPGKLRFMWDSIMYVDNTDPMFPTLRNFIADALGDAARADVILTPVE